MESYCLLSTNANMSSKKKTRNSIISDSHLNALALLYLSSYRSICSMRGGALNHRSAPRLGVCVKVFVCLPPLPLALVPF